LDKVKTLCVMATSSEPKVIEDQVEAIRWSCQTPVEIVVVDDCSRTDWKQDGCHILQSNTRRHTPAAVGYKVNEGIAWAIDQGMPFEMVMVLDDDALPIGKGLDVWALNILEDDPEIGLLGVMDDMLARKAYSKPSNVEKMMDAMKKWHNVSEWVSPKDNIFYAVNFQPRSIVELFNQQGVLHPSREVWPCPCETYQSWMTEFFGYKQKFWGMYPDDLVPPLYSMHHGSVHPEDPRKISLDFKIHHSIRNVKNVGEWEIRKHYRNIRRFGCLL